MNLFPTYIEEEEIEEEKIKEETPTEYEIDFKKNCLTGNIVKGKKAIQIWIWLALKIARYRFQIYSWDYGNEFEDLIGQVYSDEYLETELLRMTEECLLIHEQIQTISDFSMERNKDKVTISFVANTIYGVIFVEDFEWKEGSYV